MIGTKRLAAVILHERLFVYKSPFLSPWNPKLRSVSTSSPAEVTETHVYQRILKTQQPPAISFAFPFNSISFIGTVRRPLTVLDKENKLFCAFTVLQSVNKRGFRTLSILLQLYSDLARSCLEHVKLNDLIYVQGTLGCYSSDNAVHRSRLSYKISAKEVCFVKRPEEARTVKWKYANRSALSLKDRLYLWQVFLSNPGEWWDNRSNKNHKDAPDFKHKTTGEALWLDEYDPPWVKARLKALDSQVANIRQCNESRTDFSQFLPPEF